MSRDIMLEENQLPFFILVRLYRTGFIPDENPAQVPSFTDLACRFLKVDKSKISFHDRINEAECWHLLDLLRSHYKPKSISTSRNEGPDPVNIDLNVNIGPTATALNLVEMSKISICDRINEAKCCHLLDLLRSHYEPTTDLSTSRDNGPDPDNIDLKFPVSPTATSLYAASVQFKVIPIVSNSSNLLDIRFDEKKGILEIPKLNVEDSTECLFRNLTALEQCHCKGKDMYFTNYLHFLDCLMDTPEDVQLFANAGIIENYLGSHKKVSNLINSLGVNTGLYFGNKSYRTITQQLISYRRKKWNHYRATLKQKYFQHPWAAISVIYAAILLLLTLVQVVAGILAIPHVL